MLLESASIGASTRVVRIIVGVVPDAPLVVPCFFVACVRFSVSLVLPHTPCVRRVLSSSAGGIHCILDCGRCCSLGQG